MRLMSPSSSASSVTFASVTPNLIVRDVAKSTAFYRDVLGFTVSETVPAAEPFVFVWLKRNEVSVFLNDLNAAAHDYPDAAKLPPGGTAALFFIVSGVDALHAAVAPRANVIMPLKTQFYGMREFAVTDPDGHIITFAERVSGE
jgi:catechol 2,3-dioxygenase-like lactoylglutathione lyase family enzyme